MRKRERDAPAAGLWSEAHARADAEDRIGLAALEERVSVRLQRGDADHFVVTKRRREHRERRECGLDLAAPLAFDARPVAKKRLLPRGVRQQAVHHDGIARDVEEREVRERAARLVDHHSLGRHHETNARLRGRDACSQPAQLLVQQALDVAEHGGIRQRRIDEGAHQRAGDAGDRLLQLEREPQRAARDVGEREQPERRVRRRAVDDHELVAAGATVLLDGEERRQLLGARKERELFGHDVVDALVAKERDEVVSNAAPVPLHLAARIGLERVERRRHRRGPRAEAPAEDVAEAVRSVGRDDERSPPARRGADCRGRRGGGLSDPALARVEDEAHAITVPRTRDARAARRAWRS